LKANGYDGVLSYETEGNQTEEESQKMIAQSRKFMIETLKEME
jgi:sugar phosphate isomerase/epimerase